MSVDTTSARALTNAATKRISYGEVLRVLFVDASRRINYTKEPNFDDPGDVAKGKTAVRLRQEYDQLVARKAEIERQLKHFGLAIPSHGTARFCVDYQVKAAAKSKWTRQQEARLSELAKLKAQALIELVDLPRDKAKVYLLQLQRTLAKV